MMWTYYNKHEYKKVKYLLRSNYFVKTSGYVWMPEGQITHSMAEGNSNHPDISLGKEKTDVEI